MIPLSDIIILTVASALLAVALMRAYAPDDSRSAPETTTEVRQQASQPSATQTSQQVNSTNQNSVSATSAAQATTSTVTDASNTANTSSNQQTTTQSTSSATSSEQTGASQTTSPSAPAAEVIYETYTVRSGDNLSVIARRTGTTVEQLQTINQLSTTVIRVGQNLLYPSP